MLDRDQFDQRNPRTPLTTRPREEAGPSLRDHDDASA
jgi:hypothetical protein